ncbi:hypothetical protein [Lacinutrix jangbogonensis]|uniref:hypothetical protein n=1 Tax=Lacinutrix jangbogonensis TaxID=1469557 RepID=UPI00053EAC84|nr:hypothetical protein [Lacinutrix jangbogonensis]
MKKVELLFVFIIGMGFVFRLMHWPYASEILTFGILFLSMLYFWFGFALLNSMGLRAALKKESYKSISKLRLFGAVGTGFVLSFVVINSLFKLQFWPYGQVNLGIALSFLGFLLSIVILLFFIKRKQFLKENYLRFIIIGGFGLLIYSLSTDQLVELYYGSDPEYAEEYKTYIKDDSRNAKRPTKPFKSQ